MAAADPLDPVQVILLKKGWTRGGLGCSMVGMTDESRDERRRRVKAEERKRQEEVDKMLEEPRHPVFEAPATGKVVEKPADIGRSPPTSPTSPTERDDSASDGD